LLSILEQEMELSLIILQVKDYKRLELIQQV
jgi:hypothetical protein